MMTELTQTNPPPPPGGTRPASGLARLATPPVWASLALVAATLLVYFPVGWFQFVNLDDSLYVSANTHVQKGLTFGGVAWALGTGAGGNWHPLTWFSHMLDAQLFGPGPAGPHVVNLLFHLANTLLLFGLLRRLTGTLWRSAAVAALFALHPLHVESVAWISERKDVLSAFFFLLCIGAYARYVRDAEAGNPRRRDSYGAALVLYALGLMSKPMLVTLPFILLLLDYWPLERLSLPALEPANAPVPLRAPTPPLRLLLEKWPFFLLSAVSCVVTFITQKKGGAVQPLTTLPLLPRIENTPVAYARYLGKTLWPAGLATPYPRPDHWPVLAVLISAALLAGLTVAAVWLCRRARFVGTGWFWFFGMLVPVIGLVQVGEQSMADRYTYLPLIGLFIILVWGAAALCLRWQVPRVACAGLAGLLLIACVVLAHRQVGYWRNSEALYHHDLAVTHKNWLAAYNLGWYLDEQGRLDEALTYYRLAMKLEPRNPDPLNNIGVALVGKKQYAEALTYFQRALKAEPSFYEAHNNIGKALEELGKPDEAMQEYRLVLAKKPDHVGALNNLANAFAHKGQWPQAMQCYEASLKAKPDQVTANYGLGKIFARLGRTDDAIARYRRALQGHPENAAVHNTLGLALANKGEVGEATTHFREAVRLKPDDPAFLWNLGRALDAQQKPQEAIPLFLAALRIAPTNAEVRVALGQALAATRKLPEAADQFREAVRLQPRNVNAHFNLGRALAAQRKTEEAVREFNEALRLKPDFTPARQALQFLAGPKPQ
jgi:protein O-mannosyl-transferase